MATSDTDQLVQEIDVIRDRLAGSIDELVDRVAPKSIAGRAVASVKARFVDENGSVRLETVVPIVVGVVVLVGGSIVVRRVLEVSTLTAEHRLPIRMLHDRLLVSIDDEAGARRSSGGIVIPATAAMGKRLSWARVEAVGAQVRTVEPGDRVLFDPQDRAEVEVRGEDYVLLRERDLHAVAAERLDEGQTGLYL